MPTTPGLTWLGKLVVVAFVGACLYGAYWFLYGEGSLPGLGGPTPGPKTSSSAAPAPGALKIGIAYGTEKKRWLKWAVERFAETPEGKHIQIDLIPMGSLEGAQAILRGDERVHVWSPASAVYKDVFMQEWQVQRGGNPILRVEALALTPMVFVMWEERYQAFVKRYGELSFATIAHGLAERGGWATIAERPEWGLFKFGHTHPNLSNSGLMTLLLMAYHRSDKCRDLKLADILDAHFQDWLYAVEAGITGLSNSTGNMMREMVLKGPSSFDALFVYENLAIDYLKNAEGRWGTLRVEYPVRNMWNDNPYYIVDVPWSDAAHRKAAGQFLDFLLSEPVQQQALVHGFRPGNPSVPVKGPDSPFTRYAKYGVRVDLATTCEAPGAEVINNLLATWQRSQGRR